MAFALGLDCGGSSTRALMYNEAGDIVFSGRSGPANLASTPDDILAKHLREATAGCPPADAVCACLAGLVSLPDRERALGILRKIFPAARLQARPDYQATVAAAPLGTDAVLISGTGSVIASLIDREVYKTGGGGPLVGDDGSTYHLGKLALRRYINGDPSAWESGPLKEKLIEVFGTTDPGEAIATLYQHPSMASRIALLAPAVAQSAKLGLPFAEEITLQVLDSLAELIDQHVERFLPRHSEVRIGLAGGLWKIDPSYGIRLLDPSLGPFSNRAAHKRRYSCEIITEEPVVGAVRLAQRFNQEEANTPQ